MTTLLIACSLMLVQNEGCRVGCIYHGKDGGCFNGKACLCVEEMDYERLTHQKRLVLPKKAHETITNELAPAVPWRWEGDNP